MARDDDLLEAIPIDAGEPRGDGMASPPKRKHRARIVVGACAVVAVAAVVIGVVVVRFGRDDAKHPSASRPTAPAPATTAPAGPSVWKRAAFGDVLRPAAAVAAGRHVIVWDAQGAAASIDLMTAKTGPVPSGPLVEVDERGVFWTGEEVLVLGTTAQGVAALAAYSPTDMTWRQLTAPPPEAPRHPLAAVWTGDELVLWGNRRATGQTPPGARFRLSTGAWRVLPDAGVVLNQGNAVAADGSVLVVGSYLDPSNIAIDGAHALRYHPTADTWQVLDDPQLSPQATWTVRSNEAIFAWDYEVTAKALRAGADRWTSAGEPAMSFSECYPTGAATAGFALFSFCAQAGLLETEGQRWWPATPPAPFVGPPLALDDGRFLAWTEAGAFTLAPADARPGADK